MGGVRVHMMISLDGYTAGPNQGPDKPFGDIPELFLDWVFRLKSFRDLFGQEGGETGATDDVIRETAENLGATVIGRNMFGGGPGPWPLDAWNGWWGDNPPYHTPVFVLTHYTREPLVMQGGTTFNFVTEGIETALARAKEAAGDRDVRIGGGANLVNQYVTAGLVDEMELHIVPVLIGDGTRLFEGIQAPHRQLELVRAVAGAQVMHLKYRFV